MNLFLLTAPYQVLNALEAIHHFRFSNNHLRIIDTGHFTRTQFENIINLANWQSVKFYDFCYKIVSRDFGKNRPRNLLERLFECYLVVDQIRKRWLADRIAKGIGQLEHLILGNYQRDYDGHMRHIANRLRFRELYLLDVGTDTLRISRDRELDHATESTSIEAAPRCAFKRIKQIIKSALLDWDTRGVPALTFFTTYDLTPSDQDRVIHNECAYMKSLVAGAAAGEEVFFVGQPLVDQGYISRENFSAGIGRIKEFFSGQRLIYIPHPRESEAQMDVVRSLDLKIRRLTVPFEYAVAFNRERPRCISSFFSSVLENSATIFGDSLAVRAFRLPEAVLLKDRAEVAHVYAQFQANRRVKIEIVDIHSG